MSLCVPTLDSGGIWEIIRSRRQLGFLILAKTFCLCDFFLNQLIWSTLHNASIPNILPSLLFLLFFLMQRHTPGQWWGDQNTSIQNFFPLPQTGPQPHPGSQTWTSERWPLRYWVLCCLWTVSYMLTKCKGLWGIKWTLNVSDGKSRSRDWDGCGTLWATCARACWVRGKWLWLIQHLLPIQETSTPWKLHTDKFWPAFIHLKPKNKTFFFF